MSRAPSGAYPSPPSQAELMAGYRHRYRSVFGIEPPPEPEPIRAVMPPRPTNRYARPVTVQHGPGCDNGRVETTGWTDGRRIARCLDCRAERTVAP